MYTDTASKISFKIAITNLNENTFLIISQIYTDTASKISFKIALTNLDKNTNLEEIKQALEIEFGEVEGVYHNNDVLYFF